MPIGMDRSGDLVPPSAFGLASTPAPRDIPIMFDYRADGCKFRKVAAPRVSTTSCANAELEQLPAATGCDAASCVYVYRETPRNTDTGYSRPPLCVRLLQCCEGCAPRSFWLILPIMYVVPRQLTGCVTGLWRPHSRLTR